MLKIPYIEDVYLDRVKDHTIVVDTRINHLKKGEYPSIPGWHTDFAERTAATAMQPNYSTITSTVKTYIVNISDKETGVSNTEFVIEPVKLQLPTQQVYMSMHQQIQDKAHLQKVKAKDGEIYELDQLSLHTATPAHEDGYRYFMRVAILHDLLKTILQPNVRNEIREHSQICVDMKAKLKQENEEYTGLKAPLLFIPELITNSVPYFQKQFSIEEIKEERLLINSSLEFAFCQGGPIVKEFVKALQASDFIKNIINCGMENTIKINAVVNMLMKGQYSDVAVWRSGAPFQDQVHPSLSLGKNTIKQDLFVLSISNQPEGVSSIEFITDPLSIPLTGKHSSTSVEANIQAKKGIHTIRLKDSQLFHFCNGTLHRALPAHQSGWQMTLVATIDNSPIENKITRQASICLDPVGLGW